jgi:hypothetical protein
VAPLLVIGAGLEVFAAPTPELFVGADYIFTLLAWCGVFGYAYDRTLFSRRFWQVYLPFIVCWDIFGVYRYITASGDSADVLFAVGYGALIILIVVPEYIGLYLYGFRERPRWPEVAGNRNILADLVRNAASGLRLSLFMRVAPAQFRPGLVPILLGFIAIVGIIGTSGYYDAPGEVYFDVTGATVLGSIFFLVLLLAIILSVARSQVLQLPLLLTALLTAAPVYLIALYGLMHYAWVVEVHPGVWLALGCWGFVVVLRALRVAFGSIRLYEVLLIIAVASGATQGALQQYLRPDLFYSDDFDQTTDYGDIDQEAIFYRQPELVAAKVKSLAPNTPAQTDLYFLGFAGNGDQTLFRREVRFAQDLMDRNFGTRNRSLSLVNDLENLATEPLANRHNLQHTLKAVGQVMDVENDVLFLFLTSHGGRNADLEISLYPLALQGLQGDALRDFLDQSGIQWRVIVISACYSGSFIDALANEQTLIMTAASADATSFGCSDERDLTYFGEALFKDQLSSGNDLTAAFAAAKLAINAREVEEGIEASNPQLRMGARIAPKLESMGLHRAP